jgi:MSHA biogenesis protein MshG
MTRFRYRARAADGALRNGLGEAQSAGALGGRLREAGLHPIDIRPATRQAARAQPRGWLPQPAPERDALLLFTLQFQAICQARVPLVPGLQAVTAALRDRVLRRSLRRVSTDLDAGVGLADALARHPHCFSAPYVAMVRLGEQTGRLPLALKRLIGYLKHEQATRRQLLKATAYPLGVLVGVLVALGVFMSAVIPGFAEVFARFDAPLPLATRVLIAAAAFWAAAWEPVLGAATLGVLAWGAAGAHPAAARLRDRLRLRLPIVGRLRLLAAQARFARCLAMARGAGVAMPQTLELAALAADNRHVASRIHAMRTALLQGRTLAQAAGASGVLGPLSVQMLQVGEDSGRLDALIDELAEHQELALAQRLASVTGTLGPLLTFALALLVLVVALGVVLPVWELNSVVTARR